MEITGISEERNMKYEALIIKTQISSGGGGGGGGGGKVYFKLYL